MEQIKNNIKQYAMLIALIVITIFFSWQTNGILLTPQNIANLIQQNGYIIIIAIGMLLCIITGGNIDLSAGSVVACVGAIAGTLMISMKINVYLAIVLSLFAGLLIGVWQGFWIAYMRIPAFIVTLAGQLIFRGATQLILKGGQTLAPYPKDFLVLSTGFLPNIFGNGEGYNTMSLVLGIVLAAVFCLVQIFQRVRKTSKGYGVESFLMFIIKQVVFLVVIISFGYLMGSYKGMPTVMILLTVLTVVYSYFTQNTVGGRQIYALGGNEKAARLSGINTKKVMFWVYVNMSVLAAVAGLVFTSRLNAASPLAGQNFELDAIASCFIGGASTAGGTGTVFGAIVGALVMGIMNNGMSILGIGSDWQMVIKGLVLLLAVAFDVTTKAKSKG